MTTTTKKDTTVIRRKIRALQSHRKMWLTGANLHWGTPWCSGGALCHRPDPCEGCATVAHHRDIADQLGEQIVDLKAQLPGAHPVLVQGALF